MRTTLWRLTAWVVCAAWLGACAGRKAACEAPGLANRRLDQIQVIGSHNSYKRAIQPELMALMSVTGRDFSGVDYSHVSLTDQLNLGLRNLELDVYNDPQGGRYADPLGNRLLRAQGVTPWPREQEDELRTPGFKVMHDADFDFRAWHVDLRGALAALRAWSVAHPAHVPVVVTMNCKQDAPDVPGAVKPAAFDAEAMSRLNQTLLEGLGREHLLTPDDVRRGRPRLRTAVMENGWPTVAQAAGRFLFVLDEGGPTRQNYLERFPELRSAAMFVDVDLLDPNAAIFILNDPVRDRARIETYTRLGFLVRTRADADTREARNNDASRFRTAQESGAQVITTDYAIPDRKISDQYVVRFPDGGFVRARQKMP